MNEYYVLDSEHRPVPADLMTWTTWFESAERHVAKTEKDGVSVSTVFLGLDHNYGDGPPLLFETMIFGGPHNEWQDRCSTWAQAEAMHKDACELAFGPTLN